MPSSCSSLASSGRGLAVDRAMLDLAVVHLARFLGEFLPDVVGILGQVVAQFLELAAELALLRRHHRDRRLVRSGAATQAAVASVAPSLRRFEVASRGAMIAFSTLVEPQTGQVTSPRLACLS